jgi:hypothetical protein
VADADMCEFVQEYLDFVWGQHGRFGGKLYVENRVDFSTFVPDGFGTSDAFIVTADTIHVIDLKMGRVPVTATNNTQARLYAIGALNLIGDEAGQIDTVKITIVQPTARQINEWEVSKTELIEWATNVVAPAAQAALQPDAPLIPGVKQCEYCKAAGDCAALAAFCMNTVMDNYRMRNEELIDAEGMAYILKHKKLITNWLDKVESRALNKILEGGCIPGFKLVEATTRRTWDPVVDEDIIAQKLLACGIPDEKCYTRKLLSPSQAHKILGNQFKEIKELVFKPEGKPAIADENDKRPEIF